MSRENCFNTFAKEKALPNEHDRGLKWALCFLEENFQVNFADRPTNGNFKKKYSDAVSNPFDAQMESDQNSNAEFTKIYRFSLPRQG